MKRNNRRGVRPRSSEGAPPKKLRGRQAKLAYIQRDASGRYIYTGSYRVFDETAISWPRARLLRLTLAVLAVALNIGSGLIPVQGLQNTFYVILPYMSALLTAMFVLWTQGRMAWWGNPLREYVYNKTAKVLPLRCFISAALSCLTVFTTVLFVLLYGWGVCGAPLTVLFLLLQLLASVDLALLGCFERSRTWR